MNDANKVQIKGRLGQYPKFYTNKLGSMVILKVATHLRYMDKSGTMAAKNDLAQCQSIWPYCSKNATCQ